MPIIPKIFPMLFFFGSVVFGVFVRETDDDIPDSSNCEKSWSAYASSSFTSVEVKVDVFYLRFAVYFRFFVSNSYFLFVGVAEAFSAI